LERRFLIKLNDQYDEFRDCLRLVWNYALRHRTAADAAYPGVYAVLLKALVLDCLQSPSSDDVPGDDDTPIRGLGLAIANDAPDILAPHETDDEIIWERADAGSNPSGALFYYVDVFDFRDSDEMHYYDYVKAVAAGSIGSISEGAVVALRRSDVDVVDLTA
jgi:hypothetical protein